MKILIVDCNEDMLILFKQKFRKEIKDGLFYFNFVPSGETALEYLRLQKFPTLVLIFSDISLPGMSGTELLETLKLKYPEIKVFTSATVESTLNSPVPENRSRKLVKDLRADYYFNKPIELELIKTKILQLKKILG